MNSKQINTLFQLTLLFLVIVGCFGIYHLFWIADDWVERVIVFFAYGTFCMMGFMAAAFGFCGWANVVDMEERREAHDSKEDSD